MVESISSLVCVIPRARYGVDSSVNSDVRSSSQSRYYPNPQPPTPGGALGMMPVGVAVGEAVAYSLDLARQ